LISYCMCEIQWWIVWFGCRLTMFRGVTPKAGHTWSDLTRTPRPSRATAVHQSQCCHRTRRWTAIPF
jgi:hypothetical protein